MPLYLKNNFKMPFTIYARCVDDVIIVLIGSEFLCIIVAVSVTFLIVVIIRYD